MDEQLGSICQSESFFPVSPSDPMSFHVPPILTSGSPSFTLPAGFRVPFQQHGLPLFEGGFQPPRPVVRPFVSANFHVDGSSSHEGVADQSGGVNEVQVTARRRRQAGIGNVRPKPPARDNERARIHWTEASTLALIEAKKEEQDEKDGRTGRENMLSADQKYKLIEEKLAKKRIFVPFGKIQGKWEKLTTEYRKIRDFGRSTGVSPYWSMDSAQREAEKLPANFSEQVFYAMDAFLGSRPAINPVLFESSPIDSPKSEDDPAVTDPENRSASVNDFQSEPNTSASERTDDGIESARHNSGKRKKDVSKSANAIVTAMSSISESFVAVEEKRDVREARKLKTQVEAEERHFK
ncbi:hypothetical protein R1sor_018282 [Riccia sorocarpa]|uniref:Myb/SANT-like DNA-binding domain-containing protein n=1 Tax=Riccia sorocarpa TaxID=122646 RepID=A0ABD3I978_9MARC